MHRAIVLIALLGVLFGLSTAVPVKREYVEKIYKWLDKNSVDIPETDSSARDPARINYVGCYKFKFDFIADLEDESTVESCIAYCDHRDYGFAGLLRGRFCVCYDSAERYDNKPLADSECPSLCTGESTTHCGGDKTLSLYDTDVPYRYHGCFPFETDFLMNFGEKNSLSKCLQYCNKEGYDFAGVLSRNYCFCDNDYEKHQNKIALPDSDCSLECPGDFSQKCGGEDNMAYYGIQGSECLGDCSGNGKHQGDIKISSKQRAALRSTMVLNKLFPKQATPYQSMRWTNNIVLYEIGADILPIEDKITSAMKHISDNVCVKFYKYNDPVEQKLAGHSNRLVYKKLDGCWSYVGMLNQGAQEVSIGDGCEYFGTIVHETSHALGLNHEQSRTDRDGFVKILYENIEDGEAPQFNIETDSVNYNVPYDLTSVMHYGKDFFSKNGENTIQALDKTKQDVMGQRGSLSPADIQILRIMYKCTDNPVTTTTTTTTKPTTATTKPTTATTKSTITSTKPTTATTKSTITSTKPTTTTTKLTTTSPKPAATTTKLPTTTTRPTTRPTTTTKRTTTTTTPESSGSGDWFS